MTLQFIEQEICVILPIHQRLNNSNHFFSKTVTHLNQNNLTMAQGIILPKAIKPQSTSRTTTSKQKPTSASATARPKKPTGTVAKATTSKPSKTTKKSR